MTALLMITGATSVLPDDVTTLWSILLGVGVVVLAAVAVLLLILYRIVVDIDEGVQEVWRTATLVAANTATTWQLRETAAALSAVKEEALRHAELLEVQR